MPSNTLNIIGHKIRLTTFNEIDITTDHLRWLNDPTTTQFSNQRFMIHTRQSCRMYLSQFQNSNNLYLSIKRLDNNLPIGTMTAFRNDFHGTCDIGILIGDSINRGQGFGKDSFSTLLSHLKTDLTIRKITCGTLSVNDSMLRLAKSVGFQPDGLRIKHEQYNGIPVDMHYFAMFN